MRVTSRTTGELFPVALFWLLFDRRGGTGTNSPVVQELTFILLLAAEQSSKKKGDRN